MTFGAKQKIALLSPAVGTGNVGDYFIEAAIRRLLSDDVAYERFTIRRTLTDSEIDAINETSCAIICGTNLYQEAWESALTPGIVAKLRVPVIPFGVGSSAAELHETYVSDTTRQMIRTLHARCAKGSVRDPHGAAVLDRAGVTNALLTGCPVLFWAQQPSLPPIEATPRNRIVLTARNWLMHRWPDNVDNPVQIDFLRRILDAFPTDRLVFAVHEELDTRLVDTLGIPAKQVLCAETPEEYIGLYSDPANVVLAMRLHAGMLALANGVPAVFVGHDTRTYSFCEMMDLEYVELFSDRAADRALAYLQRIMSGDVGLFASVEERFQRLRPVMREFLECNGLPAAPALSLPGRVPALSTGR